MRSAEGVTSSGQRSARDQSSALAGLQAHSVRDITIVDARGLTRTRIPALALTTITSPLWRGQFQPDHRRTVCVTTLTN